jgi:hypothetical protein
MLEKLMRPCRGFFVCHTVTVATATAQRYENISWLGWTDDPTKSSQCAPGQLDSMPTRFILPGLLATIATPTYGLKRAWAKIKHKYYILTRVRIK